MLTLLHKTDKMIIAQQAPVCRSMPFQPIAAKDYGTGKAKFYYLSYPYVQYTLRELKNSRYAGFTSGKQKHYAFHATISNEPIKAITDTVYAPPIMHAFDDGAFCLGYHSLTETDMMKLFQTCINTIWSSRGQYDRAFIGYHQVEKSLGGIDKWEKLSKTEPLKILETKWQYPFKLSNLPCRPHEVTSVSDNYLDDSY
jgi:hypothetical protein